MKTDELLILGLAAMAVYFVTRGTGKGAAKAAGYVTEITNNALPGQPGFGWEYFSDGTTIDPTGTYRDANGRVVWAPM